MRLISLACALVAVSGATTTAQNDYVVYPGSTGRFISRGAMGTSEGEVFQGYHQSTVAGVGSDGQVAEIERIITPIYDLRNNTQETYGVVVRGGTDANGPDITAPALGEMIGLNTPLLTNGNTTGWYLNAGFSSPIPIPQNGFYAVGLRFEAEPTYPLDGNGAMRSPASSHRSGAQQESQAWDIVGNVANGGATVSQVTGDSYHMRIGTNKPVFQLGVDDFGTLRFGYGGMFPDQGVSVLAAQAQDRLAAANGTGVALVFASLEFNPVPLTLPGLFNNGLWLDPNVLIPITSFSLASNNGIGNASLFMIPAGIPSGTTIGFQAATTDGTSVWMSNAQNMRL